MGVSSCLHQSLQSYLCRILTSTGGMRMCCAPSSATSSQISEGKAVQSGRADNAGHVFQSVVSYVEGAISRPHVTNPYEENIYQSPDAQTSKAEQFAQTFSPLAQIKPICSEATQRDAGERKQVLRHVRITTKIELHVVFQTVRVHLFTFGAG